jgi:phospholipase/lecithinase/hemolysin
LPTTEFISPTTLELEVDKYLIDSLFRDKSQTLFVIWIGGNDYLFYPERDANYAAKVVNKISLAITTLTHYGAKNFLILNLPDLSRIPYVQGSPSSANLQALVVMHNLKLDQAIKHIQRSHSEIKISSINIYDIFNDLIDHPEKYNQKYHVNITNVTEACWTGGFFIKNTLSQKTLNEEMQQALTKRKQSLSDNGDTQAISDFIIHTPSLSYTYNMGSAYVGNPPCANVNEYVFWDLIHPTEVAHYVLSQVVIETLGDQQVG